MFQFNCRIKLNTSNPCGALLFQQKNFTIPNILNLNINKKNVESTFIFISQTLFHIKAIDRIHNSSPVLFNSTNFNLGQLILLRNYV